MDEAKQVFRRNGGADKFLVAVIPDLVGHHPDAGNAQILCQTLDVVVGLHRSCAGLDHHDELIHVGGRTPSQMLQTRFHIHDDHIVLPIGQRGKDGLQHHMLGADAAAAAHVHGTHDQQLHAVDLLGEGVRDVRHIGVQLEELIGGIRAGALLHQGAHLGNGDDGVHFLLAQSESQSQIGVRVHVGGQDGTSLVGVEPRQRGGQRGLSHAALAGNR